MNEEMMITGKWFNKNTGEVVTVVNNVIDGDDMVIITDKGPIKLQDFTEYVQMSDEIYDEHGKVIGKEQANYNIIPPKPVVTIKETKKPKQQNRPPAPLPEEQNLEFDDSTFISVPEPIVTNSTSKKAKETVQNNDHIISKFFNKIDNINNLLHIELDTSILPINDLKTIINYMDVSIEDISKYISNTLIDKSYLNNIIENTLKEILEKVDS